MWGSRLPLAEQGHKDLSSIFPSGIALSEFLCLSLGKNSCSGILYPCIEPTSGRRLRRDGPTGTAEPVQGRVLDFPRSGIPVKSIFEVASAGYVVQSELAEKGNREERQNGSRIPGIAGGWAHLRERIPAAENSPSPRQDMGVVVVVVAVVMVVICIR
jgi:hypothetical protein